MAAIHDPDAEYVAAQMLKIHSIFVEMEHHLGGRPQHEYQAPLSHTTASPAWAMPAQTKAFAGLPTVASPQLLPSSAPVSFSPRRLEHLAKIKEMKEGIHRTSVTVKNGDSLFRTSRARWIIRGLLGVAALAFIGFVFWIAWLIHHMVYFRRA